MLFFENKINYMKKKIRIIEVPVPKEIWDAHMSIWNCNRDIFGAWANSIVEVVEKLEK